MEICSFTRSVYKNCSKRMRWRKKNRTFAAEFNKGAFYKIKYTTICIKKHETKKNVYFACDSRP